MSWGELSYMASRSEKCMMYWGLVFAALGGAGTPAFVFLMGDVLDGFDPNQNDPEATLNTTRNLTWIFVGIGFGVWLCVYMYWVLMLTFAERVSHKIKQAYLKAILQQECAWFDQVNY